MFHPTAHNPRRGDPGGVARRPLSGAPTVRLVHGGVQYREYLREEQRSQRGCIAGRMQLEFHHGLQAWGSTRAMLISCCVSGSRSERACDEWIAVSQHQHLF